MGPSGEDGQGSKSSFDALEVLFEVLRNKEGQVLAADLLSVSTKAPEALAQHLRQSAEYSLILKPELWGSAFLQSSKEHVTLEEFKDYWRNRNVKLEDAAQLSGRTSASSGSSRRRLSRKHSILKVEEGSQLSGRTSASSNSLPVPANSNNRVESAGSVLGPQSEREDVQSNSSQAQTCLFKLGWGNGKEVEIDVTRFSWSELLEEIEIQFQLRGGFEVVSPTSKTAVRSLEEMEGKVFHIQEEMVTRNVAKRGRDISPVSKKAGVTHFSEEIQDTIVVLLNRFMKARGVVSPDRHFKQKFSLLSRGNRTNIMRMEEVFKAASDLRLIPALSRSQLRILIDVIDSKNKGCIRKSDFLLLAKQWYSTCSSSPHPRSAAAADVIGGNPKSTPSTANTSLGLVAASEIGVSPRRFDSVSANNTQDILEGAMQSLKTNLSKLETVQLARALSKIESQKELSNSVRAKAAGLLAFAHALLRDFTTADTTFERALDLSSSELDVFVLYGNYLLNLGKIEQASDQFMQALLLDENSVTALLGYAEVLACSTSVKSAKAEHYFERALEEAESNPKMLSTVVCKYALYKSDNLGQHGAALCELNRSLALDSDNMEAHFAIGCIWLCQRRSFKHGLVHLHRVLALDQNAETGLLTVAQILSNSDDEADWQEASRIYNQLVTMDSVSASTLMSYVEFCETVVQCREKSKKYFSAVLTRTPTEEKWKYMIKHARILFERSTDSRRGAKLVAKALKSLVSVNGKDGEMVFKDDSCLNEDVYSALRDYARYCLSKGEVSKGRMLLQLLLTSYPLDPEVMADVAEAQLATGNECKAFRWLKKCLEKNPRNVRAQLVMAKLLHRASTSFHYEASPESLARRVLAKEPRNGSANLLLGELLISRKNHAEALMHLQRCVVAGTDAEAASAFLDIAEIHLVEFLEDRKWYRLFSARLPNLASPNLKLVFQRLNLANNALAYCLRVGTISSKEKAKALMRIAIIQLLTGKMLGQQRGFLNSMISLDSIGNGYDQNAEIWLLKGLCLQQTAQVQQAKEAFIAALREDCKHSVALLELGLCWCQEGEFAHAKRCIDSALTVAASTPVEYSNVLYRLKIKYKEYETKFLQSQFDIRATTLQRPLLLLQRLYKLHSKNVESE